MKLFELMEIPHGFINIEPDLWWEAQDGYQEAARTVRAMSVVNDHAEHGVALIQELIGLITKDVSKQQQMTELHRHAGLSRLQEAGTDRAA